MRSSLARLAPRTLVLTVTAIAPTGSAASAQDVPIVELSAPVATYADGLGTLRGVRQLPDGRYLIADGLGEALIVWSPGAGADTLTNVGQGPNEYRTPDALFPLPDGGTLLVDLGNARLAELTSDLEIRDTRPLVRGRAGPGMTLLLPTGTDDRGRIYFRQREGGFGPADSASIARLDPATDEVQVLGRVKLQDEQRQERGGPNNRSVDVRPRPYTPQDAWGVGRQGRVAVARGAPYRLEWIEPDGRVVAGPVVTYDPIRVRDAEKRAYLDRLGSDGLAVEVVSDGGPPKMSFSRGGGRGASGSGIDDYEWPDVLPPFDGNAVRVDSEGRAWVRRLTRAGEPALFDLFDGRGRRVGQARLPGDRRLIGFGDGVVFVARSDDLDFDWLEIFELPALST